MYLFLKILKNVWAYFGHIKTRCFKGQIEDVTNHLKSETSDLKFILNYQINVSFSNVVKL